jgi:hypothetical protein
MTLLAVLWFIGATALIIGLCRTGKRGERE